MMFFIILAVIVGLGFVAWLLMEDYAQERK